ncbi:putative 2OG-Fe(II) oxygenase superfamily protein [Seiridium cardinale]
MAIATESPQTSLLRLASVHGPITRPVLRTPLRDALPTEIPIVDLSDAFSSSPESRKSVAGQIRQAAISSGFFYISNHGIDSSLISSAHAACLDFFRQDEDIKMRAWTGKSRHHNGYRPSGTQRINKNESVDVRESFSWRYDPRYDPGVDVNAIDDEAKSHVLMEDFHRQATSNLPQFEESMVEYYRACLQLSWVLVRSFALSLDLPEDHFDTKSQCPDATLTLNYYPPISDPASPSKESSKVSIGSHTDFQLFTILWQDAVGGLQVLNREGQWIRAAPIEGTFVVNIADYMQRITNDLYVSTVHRAQNWSGKERVSMPFFFGFGLHETCGIVKSCVAEGEKPKYDEISCGEWLKRRVEYMLEVESDDESGD